jgi:hypothetical protein
MNWGNWVVQKIRAFSWWKDMIMHETYIEATRGIRHGSLLDDRPTRIFRDVMRATFGGSLRRVKIVDWIDIPIALCFIALVALYVPGDVLRAIGRLLVARGRY